MPRVLVAHKSFLQCTLLEIANEIAISSTSLLSPATTPARTGCRVVYTDHAFTRRWIICRAWLEANWLSRVKVASHPLNCSWNTTLLLLHGRRSLSVCTHTSLLIHIGLGNVSVLRSRHWLRRLTHNHRPVLTTLRSVGRGHVAVTSCRRVPGVGAIHWRRLHMTRLRRILSGSSHVRVRSLRCRVGLSLRCLCALLAQSLCLLLLLCSWSR